MSSAQAQHSTAQHSTAQHSTAQHRRVELDALRGIAILLVVFHHWSAVTIKLDPNGVVARITALSWSGVDLFFVLSGFLIGGILLDHRESPSYFRTFYVRRACRILPPYFLLLTVFFCVHLYLSRTARWFYGPPLPWMSYLTLTQNFFMVSRPHVAVWLLPTWSLAVEEHFYIALPLLIRLVRPHSIPRFAMGTCIAAPILRTILFLSMGEAASAASYVLLPCRADALMLGVLLAYLERFKPHALNRFLRPGIIVLGLLCIGLLMYSPDRDAALMMTVGYSVIALFYASVILMVTRAGVRLFRNRLLASIGVRAYALYLFHVLIISLLRGNEPSTTMDPVATMLSAGLLAALTTACWTYLEKPLIDWGHRWKYAPAPQTDKTVAIAG